MPKRRYEGLKVPGVYYFLESKLTLHIVVPHLVSNYVFQSVCIEVDRSKR